MGQIFRRLGSQVTVVNNSDRLANCEDTDVSAIIKGFFEDEGAKIITNATIVGVEKSPLA